MHKTIDSIASKGFDRSIVVRDWIDLMFCSFISKRTPDDPYEQEYLGIMEKYKRYDELPLAFPRLLSFLLIDMQETDQECLSSFWQTYCRNESSGQFFTPWEVCVLMARMKGFPGMDWSFYSSGRPCKIDDPACGAGLTLLAAWKEIPPEHAGKVMFVGQDIDRHCCRMAAMNMLFFNAEADITWGDTLRDEKRKVWRISRSAAFGATLSELKLVEKTKRKRRKLSRNPWG